MELILIGLVSSVGTAAIGYLVTRGVIDKAIRKADERNATGKRKREIDAEMLDAHTALFKRIAYGIRQFQKTEEKEYWNGEFNKAMDIFIEVERKKDDFLREIQSKID